MSNPFEIALQREDMMTEMMATTWYAFEKDGGVYQIIGKCSSEEEAMRTARNPLANPDDIAFVISAQEFLDLADGVRHTQGHGQEITNRTIGVLI
jgi:hypothetical protein